MLYEQQPIAYMLKASVNFENCYGIKKLTAEFDFTGGCNVFTVYAPNGVMKTSFANTFLDHSNDIPSSDRIWPSKTTTREIKDEHGHEINKNNVFVIEPYNQKFKSGKLSTLLVDEALKSRFDAIHADIDKKADDLASALKANTGLKAQIREEFAEAITHDRKSFYLALSRVKDEVIDGENSNLSTVIYSTIFNPKAEELIKSSGFKDRISAYIEKYDALLQRSTFFRKGVFTHNNASEIAKTLSSNGFFRANHSIYLRIEGEKREISTLEELETAIQVEKDQILTNSDLRKAFDDIDKQLIKNAELRALRKSIEDNPHLIPELEKPELLKQKLWISYLIEHKDLFRQLVDAHSSGRSQLAEIAEEAREQQTKWAEVISIFNQRFSVPFVVRMENQEDVILRSTAPAIAFDFLEDNTTPSSPFATVQEESLMQVLSNGEKRALYILNIIFEVEARKSSAIPTLFVVDDIADSFDYKNKYAIVEYLKEVSENPNFHQIILSHNFDFYRTVSSRLGLPRRCKLFASKTSDCITLHQEHYQKSPFNHWRANLTNARMLVAAIPFLRNLCEFSGDDATSEKLTSLLHLKADTDSILISDLQSLVQSILKDQAGLNLLNPTKPAKDLIFEVADGIVVETPLSHSLEAKVALSIAIRLKTEQLMIGKIAEPAFVAAIISNQTIKLIEKFKSKFPTERAAIRVFDQVNLMTPENIHLNSFMYEPILDLSSEHLKNLYNTVSALRI